MFEENPPAGVGRGRAKERGRGRGRGDTRNHRLARPPPNPPRLSPDKRITTAASASSASTTTISSSFHIPKKTRHVPDLFLCHSCGLRFPSDDNNPLDHLRSQWRIALLCRTCLARVKSAALCSYCFAPVALAESSLSCLRCTCRIHLCCVNREHRWVEPWRLDPGSFVCIDCCAIPKCRGRSPGFGSRVSLEEIVREARAVADKKTDGAARARGNAVKKDAAAKHAIERARSAFGAIQMTEGENPERGTVLALAADEELALQLHLAINGSRRISRSSCSLRSGGSSFDLKAHQHRRSPIVKDTGSGCIDLKVYQRRGNLIGKGTDSDGRCSDLKVYQRRSNPICKGSDSDGGFIDLKVYQRRVNAIENVGDSGGHGICKPVDSCTEDKFPFVTARTGHGEGSDVNSCSENNKLTDTNRIDGHADMRLKEDHCSSSDKVVNSLGEDRSIDSISLGCEMKEVSDSVSVPSTCRGYAVEELELKQKDCISTSDRYLKNYFVRRPKMKESVDEKDNQLIS